MARAAIRAIRARTTARVMVESAAGLRHTEDTLYMMSAALIDSDTQTD